MGKLTIHETLGTFLEVWNLVFKVFKLSIVKQPDQRNGTVFYSLLESQNSLHLFRFEFEDRDLYETDNIFGPTQVNVWV